MPGLGVVLLGTAALAAVGLPDAALGVLYGLLGVFAVAAGVSAARKLRQGKRRSAAVSAVGALLLGVACGALVAGWNRVIEGGTGVVAFGLLATAVTAAVRKWRVSDPVVRRGLLSSVLLGFGLLCQAVSNLLPAHQYRHLELTLIIVGVVAPLGALVVNIDQRRRSRAAGRVR